MEFVFFSFETGFDVCSSAQRPIRGWSILGVGEGVFLNPVLASHQLHLSSKAKWEYLTNRLISTLASKVKSKMCVAREQNEFLLECCIKKQLEFHFSTFVWSRVTYPIMSAT